MPLELILLWNVFQIHFGVNSGATRFALENQAVNEATFRCPDELGWKPQVALLSNACYCYLHLQINLVDAFWSPSFVPVQRVPIVPSDGSISRTREVKLDMFDLMGACWICLCSLTSFNVLLYLILYLEFAFCARYLPSKVCEVDNQISLMYLVVPTKKIIDMLEYCNLSLPITSIWIQASICEKLTDTMINNLVDLWLSLEHTPQQYYI